MVPMLSKEHLIDMFEKQENLNIKYNGDEWRKSVSLGKVKFAFLDEVGEFLKEIESDWKWWKKYPNYHKQKAIFELIDIIHFALMLCLYENSVDEIKDHIFNLRPQTYDSVGDKENQFSKTITSFFRRIDDHSMIFMIFDLLNLIQQGAELLEVNPGDIYQAYVMKNSRNHERINGGVLVGKYDKKNETDLHL